jgi:predicted Zn finger-like uncharacterized protein
MLLTCPACSAQYKVQDNAIPPLGRNVRCAACGHSWLQTPDPGVLAAFEAKKAARQQEEAAAKAKPPPPAPHAKMRKRTLDNIVLTHRLAAGIAWGVAGLIALGAGTYAVMHRTDIVRAWPKSASAFALIGFKANLYGVDISRVQARALETDKGPRIVVGGVLRNVSRKTEAVPLLRVSLIDTKGIEKASWMFDPGVTSLDAGKFKGFETGKTNPPRGQLKAVVTFAEPPLLAPRPPPLPAEPPTGKTGLMGAVNPEVGHQDPHAGQDPHAPVTAR